MPLRIALSTILSKILKIRESNDMGWYFLAQEGSPFLKMGVMLEMVQSAGTRPTFKEWLNRLVSGLKMARFVSRIMVLDIPSGPVATFHRMVAW